MGLGDSDSRLMREIYQQNRSQRKANKLTNWAKKKRLTDAANILPYLYFESYRPINWIFPVF